MPEGLWLALCIVGGLLAVFLVGGLLLPREFSVTRSIVIAAPPERTPDPNDDLANWPLASPFDPADPDIVLETAAQRVAGVGARRSWKSRKMGNGSQWITSSDPRKGVSMKLAIGGGSFEPFDLDFALSPEAGGTRVAWTDSGRMPSAPHWRWMGALFLGPICGKQFDKRLAALKRLVEEEAGRA